jgi:nicotinamide mononucleotide transporter
MSISEITERILQTAAHSAWYEWLAVISGIVSVWFSKIENIWVYPIGLINTIIYTWISFEYHLPGEASVNFYYTVMSLFGWYNWLRKTEQHKPLVKITMSTSKEWQQELLFFAVCYAVLFFSLTQLQSLFFEGAIPWADALASAAAFTGMWLMTKKKVESWYWWILTNVASIPLYFVKGLTLTSVYYCILLIIAFGGLFSWQQKAKTAHA